MTVEANESDEYVMVEFNFKRIVGEDDLVDDGSYDYCDDLYSVHSSCGQTVATVSEADSNVLSVPSGLLKDLDEAHAAAKLAIQQGDAEDVLTTDSQSITVCTPEEHDKEVHTSVISSVTENEAVKVPPKTTVPIKHAPLSRISNKKRRKQMKLMKKAKAAAQASKALSERAARMATSSSSSVSPGRTMAKAKKATRNGRLKRVHPHVACAHDGIAAYYDEVRVTNQKLQ